MLNAIEFGTFYFFLGRPSPSARFISASNTGPAFCIFLWVWVFFWVPETKGVRIEEMDKLFGGNQGEQDLQRIADIRERLGISSDGVLDEKEKDSYTGAEQLENPEKE